MKSFAKLKHFFTYEQIVQDIIYQHIDMMLNLQVNIPVAPDSRFTL